MFDPKAFLILPHRAIAEAIVLMDGNGTGIVLIADAEGRLIGTVTDGDIRRALLRHVSLDSPVGTLLDRPASSPHPVPLTAIVGTPPATLIELMRAHQLRHIPLLDGDGRVIDLAVLDRLTLEATAAPHAVVMAGGMGTRLRPLTSDMPKPMLPIGATPLIERLVRDIGEAGIHRVHVTTHFQPEKIRNHLGSGEAFGVDLSYVAEDEPLGTAGALRLVEEGTEPLLVVNGDILTKVNFRALFDYHSETGAVLTVGVRSYEMGVPYGVIEMDGPLVRRVVEKPTYRHFVNTGIYVVDRSAIRHIPEGRRFDMTDLIERLISHGERVVAFPVREYWRDIGRREDYERAQLDHEQGALK